MNNAPPVIELIERGPGWWECPIRAEALYGFSYWEEYRARDQSPMGHALTFARVSLVRKHKVRNLVDVGIGGGAFITAASASGIATAGTDVNEHALGWLEHRHQRWNGRDPVEAMTFWDSLEHIEYPALLLARTRIAFISTPIYRDLDHVRKSKHLKPGEHLHFWTDAGLKAYMQAHGFEVIESNTMESDLGREDIGTYVCRRSKV